MTKATSARWITSFTTRFDLVDGALQFHDADGRSHDFPLPKVCFIMTPLKISPLSGYRDDKLLLCRGFERKETYVRSGSGFCWPA
jgi:hypothetical protein